MTPSARNSSLVVAVVVAVFLACAAEPAPSVPVNETGEPVPTESDEYAALKYAVAASTRAHYITDVCDKAFSGTHISSSIYIVSINEDVISAVRDYHRSLELPRQQGTTTRIRAALADSASATYGVFINTTYGGIEPYEGMARFQAGLDSTAYLKDEFGTEYNPVGYTRTLDEAFRPGWTDGYLYFPSQHGYPGNSYSIHFNDLHLQPCKTRGPVSVHDFSFSYPVGEVDYLSYLRQGIDPSSIIEQNTTTASADVQLMDIARNAQTLIYLLKGIFWLFGIPSA